MTRSRQHDVWRSAAVRTSVPLNEKKNDVMFLT